MTDDNGERRVNWARTVADIAVIKEIQIQQAATLLKVSTKLDLLWDQSQRDQGARSTEQRSNLRWRWMFGTIIAILGVLVATLALVVALIRAKVI